MKKVVVIVGVSRGLGLEFATQYLADGWQVIGTVRHESDAAPLRKLGIADVFILDARREEDFEEFASALRKRGFVPEIIIHNAGVNIRPNVTFAETNFADWEQTLGVNVVGAVGTARYLVPLLPENAKSKAVFLSSELGSIEQCFGGMLPYRASKAALNMLVKSLSIEQAPRKVTCLAIHPGWVKTDMGGPEAPLEAPDSIRQMRATIAKATMADNGAFLDYKGTKLPY
jgi:NAD(P)-dependent dehydrogenase (short-subunit alcohol dehydrogenase family)